MIAISLLIVKFKNSAVRALELLPGFGSWPPVFF